MAVRRGARGGVYDRHRLAEAVLDQLDHRWSEGGGQHRDPAPESRPQLQRRADPAEGDRIVGMQFVQDEQGVRLLQQHRGVPRPGDRRPQQLVRGGDAYPLREQPHRPRAGASLTGILDAGGAVLRHGPGEQSACGRGVQHPDIRPVLARWRIKPEGEPVDGRVDGRPVGQHPDQSWSPRHRRELGGRPGQAGFGLAAAGRRGQDQMPGGRRGPPLMIIRRGQPVEEVPR